jgi:hypothetical protein
MRDPVLTLINKMLKVSEFVVSDLDEGDVLPPRETESISNLTIDELSIRKRAPFWCDKPDDFYAIQTMREEVEKYTTNLAKLSIQSFIKRSIGTKI